MYALSTALTELKRSDLWNEASVSYEPLVGMVDGDNRVFNTAHAPIASLTVYDNELNLLALTTDYTVPSYVSGTVVFVVPLSAPAFASYTVQELTDTQLTNLLRDGLDEMELRWNRGLWFYGNGDSADVISSSSAAALDPATGNSTFSTSRTQIALYLRCCEYRMALALQRRAANKAITYREERAGGLLVDTSKTPQAWELVLVRLNDDIQKAIVAAQDETAVAGYYIPGTKSDDWVDNFDWWEDSKQERGLVG
jgi:hypothetical protein